MIYDDLDWHLPLAPDLGAAAVPMGFFMSWAVIHQLTDDRALADHETQVLRIRFREAKGSELVVACGGTLSSDLFTPAGQRFVEGYYDTYLDDYRGVFGEDVYLVEETWANYELIAKVLTARHRGPHRSEGLLSRLTAWLGGAKA